MLKFDNTSGKNLLIMKKVDLPEPKNYDSNILSDIKQSFDNYCNLEGTVVTDLQYLFDTINQTFTNRPETNVRVQVTDIEEKVYDVPLDVYATKRRYYSVIGSIYSNEPGRDGTALIGPIELFRVPHMDSRGVLTIDTSTKSLVNCLQAAEGVSYSRKDHEINVQLGSRNIKFRIENSGKFSMSTSKKKHQLVDNIFYGCAEIEKLGVNKAFEEFSQLHNSAIIRNSTITGYYDPSAGLTAAKAPLIDLYANPAYRLNTKARNELNKACQLDRAMGEVLSRDVVVGNKTIAKRGEVVTKSLIKEFKKNYVTLIYVRHIPDLAGLTPATIPPITVIANGTRINNYVRHMLNGNYGYFVAEDIRLNLTAEDLAKGAQVTLFSAPGILNEKGKLQPEHVEALYNVYIGLENAADAISRKSFMTADDEILRSLYLRNSCSAIRVHRQHGLIDVPLDVEITTNGTFLGDDIGKESGVWYTRDAAGNIIKQSDDTREFVFKLSKDNLTITPYDGTYLNRNDIKALYSMIGWYSLEPESRILMDRDEMLLKKVKTVNDIFSESFRKAVNTIISTKQQKAIIQNLLRANKYPQDIYKVLYILQKNFNSQLIKDKLVQTADTKNPAATLSQISNITTVVQSSKAVSEDQRLLSFAYASRICPYETPASNRIGLVNHKAMGCRINEEGLLVAYYRRVDKTQHRVTNDLVQMTAAEASNYNIADLLSLHYTDESKGLFKDTPVTAMVPNESKRGEAIVVETISSYEVDFVFATPEATVSATAMLIPFLGADDTARISFGLSMQKQAINCLENEKPRVMTSMYTDILKYNDYYAVHAEHSGTVISIDSNDITVEYATEDNATDVVESFVTDSMYLTDKVQILVGMLFKNTGRMIIPEHAAREYGGTALKAPFPCKVESLVEVPGRPEYSRLNIVPYRPEPISKIYNKQLVEDAGLKVGDEVRAGESIIPKDMVLAHELKWEAQLYKLPHDCTIETIAPFSEEKVRVRYVPKDKRTLSRKRLPCHAIEINQSDCVFMHYDKAPGEHFEKGDILAHASVIKDGVYSPARNALVCYLPTGYNYEDAIDMSQDCARHYTAVAAHTQEVSASRSSDFDNVNSGYISEGTPIFTGDAAKRNKAHNVSGYYLNRMRSKSQRSSEGRRSYATVRLLAFNNQHEGDKMAGRHGNKGVQARVCENSKMPMFLNGRIPDICLNPCGVPSRMNIGQNLEAHLGFIATMLDVYIVSDPFNGASRDDIRELMSYVWRLANEDDVQKWDAITSEFSLPMSLVNHAKKNYDYIHSWKGCFNEDGTARMWDPVSQRMFENPIAFGVAYFLKLEQEADEKIHARAGMDTSAYVDSSGQPTHTRKKGGGQRDGEMELVTIGAYGAVETLHESLHEKSDNVGRRYELTCEMLGGQGASVSEREKVPQANDMVRYLLEALGVHMDISDLTPEESKYLKPIDKFTSETRKVYNHTDIITDCRHSDTHREAEISANVDTTMDDMDLLAQLFNNTSSNDRVTADDFKNFFTGDN